MGVNVFGFAEQLKGVGVQCETPPEGQTGLGRALGEATRKG